MEEKMYKYNNTLLEEFARVNTIFDFFAIVIQYLLTRGKRSSDYSKEEFEEDMDEITVSVETFFDKYENISDRKRLLQLCRGIKDFFKDYIADDRQFCLLCMKLVRAIDDNLIVSEWDAGLVRSSGCSDYFEYEFLNDNYTDKIGILPKLNDSFIDNISESYCREYEQELFRDEKDEQELCVSDIVTNYLVFDQQKEPLASCRTFYFPQKYFIGKHFSEIRQLKIGISPLIFHNVKNMCEITWKDPSFPNGKGAFTIDGFKNGFGEELPKRYHAVVEKAKEEKIDFLIFPELLVAPEFVEQLNLEGKLPLIINGSFWRDNQNCCSVSDSTSHVICKYFKKVAFEMEDNGKQYRENLADMIPDSQSEYVLLDFEGFARVGLCICRDLDASVQRMFHKRVREDILFVPSFSKSTDMRRAAMELSENHQMLVVVANSCSALWEDNKAIEKSCDMQQIIGYIAVPGKRKNQRGAVLHNYCMDGRICNKCEEQNISCCNMVTIDVKQYARLGEIWTLKVCQSFPSKIETDFGDGVDYYE